MQGPVLSIPLRSPSGMPTSCRYSESTITRAVPTDAGGRVKLLVGNADVQVLPSNSQQLEIRLVRKVAATDWQEASTFFPEHSLHVAPDPNGWTVTSVIDADEMANHFGRFSIRIYVPDGYGVDLPTSEHDVLTTVGAGQFDRDADGPVAFRYSNLVRKPTAASKLNFEAPESSEQIDASWPNSPEEF